MNTFMLKTFFYIVILILACKSKETIEKHDYSHLELPFKEGNEWLYDASYLKSEYFVNNKYKPYENPIKTEDTVKIILKKVTVKDSVKYFFFNREFNIRWYKNLILIEDEGYQNNFASDDNLYFYASNNYVLKYPIKLGHKWKNQILEGFEVYEYTNIDTSITISGTDYPNSVELTLKFGYNYWPPTDTSIVKIYLNRDYGLIYYYDTLLEEEYKLLDFQR